MMVPIRWPVVLGPLLVLTAVAGLWRSADEAERAVADTSDADLARHATAFLEVLTPAGPSESYNAPRLLSAANTLADASFWRGGIQVTMGSVALVADSIGLMPIPDSLLLELEHGAASVVAIHARHRSTLVPFLSRDRRTMLGWVAAWGTVERQFPGKRHVALLFLVLIGLVAATVTLMRYTRPGWRALAVLTELGLIGLLALTIGFSVSGTAHNATDIRLLTLRRLVEIAATAEGVQQSRLREIGTGTFSRRISPPLVRPDDVIRGDDDPDSDTPVARVVAATPRTQGGLEFRVTPADSQLGGLWLAIFEWLGLAAVGLVLTAAGGPGPPAPESG